MDPIWYNNNVFFNNTATNKTSLPPLEALELWPWQVFLISLYSITSFISLGSNIITIIVLIKGDQMSSELWKFLVNLSVSDIAMSLFSIPFTYTVFMLGKWIFPTQLCPVVMFAQLCSVFVSVWTLTAIGIDRYFAIVYPFRSLLWIKTHKVTVISIIWLTGITVGISQLIKSKAEPFIYDDNAYYDCREDWTENGGKIYTIFIFAVTFVIPIVALAFVYTMISIHVMRHSMPGNPDLNRDEARVNKNVKVIKMLFTIVLLFALCWLPIHVFQLLVWFYPTILNLKYKVEYYTYVGLYFLCHWLSMAHSFINPLVYCFMSENFRNNLRSLLKVCYTRLKRCDNFDDHLDVNCTQDQTLSTFNHSMGLRNHNQKKSNKLLSEQFV